MYNAQAVCTELDQLARADDTKRPSSLWVEAEAFTKLIGITLCAMKRTHSSFGLMQYSTRTGCTESMPEHVQVCLLQTAAVHAGAGYTQRECGTTAHPGFALHAQPA